MYSYDAMISKIQACSCREDVIEAISQCIDHNDNKNLICILKKYKCCLQQQINTDFALIDCIDCFIYKIEKYDKKAS